jgi:hypothetical protein
MQRFGGKSQSLSATKNTMPCSATATRHNMCRFFGAAQLAAARRVSTPPSWLVQVPDCRAALKTPAIRGAPAKTRTAGRGDRLAVLFRGGLHMKRVFKWFDLPLAVLEQVIDAYVVRKKVG